MKIILSPAKKMRVETDLLMAQSTPRFPDKTGRIREWLRQMTYEEVRGLWQCSDRIARSNYRQLHAPENETPLTPAILAYDGIQYQYMAPAVFEESHLQYVGEHLRILSGYYGILRPFDGVRPYRLEMRAQGSPYGGNLYRFWKDDICRALEKETDCVVNLASAEYSRCVEDWMNCGMCYVTCVFGEKEGGRVIQKGVRVKMARGEMVRFMAEEGIRDWRELKRFDRLGYRYSEEDSGDRRLVFLKEKRTAI